MGAVEGRGVGTLWKAVGSKPWTGRIWEGTEGGRAANDPCEPKWGQLVLQKTEERSTHRNVLDLLALGLALNPLLSRRAPLHDR